MASPGPEALKIVLVSVDPASSGDEFKQALIQELERRKIVVLQTSVADAEQDIDEHQPHLVVLCGTRGASVLSTLLDDGLQGTRPRLVVTALRSELAKLQGLNRNVVAGLLASDLGERLVVERLQTLARQAAQLRQGLWKKHSPALRISPSPQRSPQPNDQDSRLSANPATPEFFKGVDADILDPLFPSAKPAPPKPTAPATTVPRPTKPKEAPAEAPAPPVEARGEAPPEAPPSPAADEPPAEPPRIPSASSGEDSAARDDSSPTPPPANLPAPIAITSSAEEPGEAPVEEEAPKSLADADVQDEPDTSASPHPAPTRTTPSEAIEDLSDLAEPASSRPPEPEASPPPSPVAPPEAAPTLKPLPEPEPPQSSLPQASSSSASKRAAMVATGLLIVSAAAAAVWLYPTWKRPPAPNLQKPLPTSSADTPTTEEPAASVRSSQGQPDDETEPVPSQPAPSATTDPFYVEEANVPGCEELLRDFRPQMVDPLQEASLAWKEARDAIVKGELRTAEEKMCVAVQLHPESAALETLALHYLTQQAPRRAATYLERAEKVRPGETETINLRGDIHSQLGESDKALEAWLRALKLQPDETARRRMAAQDYTRQGQGHFRRGALPQAERWFRRAVALDPENVMALTGLAEVFLKMKRFPQAANIAQRALNVSTYNPQAHVVLGDVARAAGDDEAARKSYEAALAVRSDHWPAKARLQELKAASR